MNRQRKGETLLRLAALFFLAAAPCLGQSYTTVTATVTDSSGAAYILGTYTVTLSNTTGQQATFGGSAIFQQVFSGLSLDASGKFSISLPSVTVMQPSGLQWIFNVCANPKQYATVFPQPANGVCFSYTSTGTQVSGASVDLSSSFTVTRVPVSGGGANSAGPVINVSSFGASSATADNNAAFTAASTAYNAATLTAGNPAVKNSAQGPNCVTCTSVVVSMNIAPLDTVFVFLTDFTAGATVTVTDNGGNVYSQLAIVGGAIRMWATVASGAVASATTITVTTTDTPRNLNAMVVSFTNVGSYRFAPTITGSGTSSTPTYTATTGDTNNLLVTGFEWFNGGSQTASQNTGTLQQSCAATPTTTGCAVVTQSAASLGTALTNSITLSASSTWQAIGLELRSRTYALPVLYIPAGTYNYSGGLSLGQPGTLKCDGATLNYIGSAHAVDVGASGLTNATQTLSPIGVDGCVFNGGALMTEGVFFNRDNGQIFVRNSTFRNFGNSTSHMIAGTCENWDGEVEGNRFYITDGSPRIVYISSTGACSQPGNNFVRFHDNNMQCWTGDNPATTCTNGQGGVGISVGSFQARIVHNDLASWSPMIRVTAGTAYIIDNQIEATSDGASPSIQFSGSPAFLVAINNSGNQNNQTVGFIAPTSGTDTLANSLVANNKLNGMLAATPVVQLNNLAGQTGNYSYGNTCATVNAGSLLPCPLIHTAGGNISQWNADQWPQLAFSAATSASYTFSQTYSAAPKCGAPVAVSPGTTTFTITTLNTTTLTVTASASFTGTVTVPCSAGDGQ